MNKLDALNAACRECALTLSALFDTARARYSRLAALKHTRVPMPPWARRGGSASSSASSLPVQRPAGPVVTTSHNLDDDPDRDPDDMTIVESALHAPLSGDTSNHDGSATVVKGTHRTGGSATAGREGASSTGNDGSLNRADWQRVAQAQSDGVAYVGMLLKGRFLLERELGRGGMGVVYLAKDERKVEARDRDPYVAVKVLNDEFRRHPDSLIALQREARRAQRLADDHIVHVYDFDKDGTIVYMTMEYIDGTDLRTLIRERAPMGMRFGDAWPLIEGMARALQRAHASGIVHSDFKPGNVMVTRDGTPKVFDFGIARAGLVGAGAGEEQTVFDAGTLGAMTPAYASLEMLSGAHPTSRDDVYALGCVIFELLTGRHPFDRHSADAASHERLVPPTVPSLSRRQQKALADAVAFQGNHRLRSVEALIDGLRRQSMHERIAPYFLAALAAGLFAAGGTMLHNRVQHHQLQTTIARFADASPQHYANEDEAMTALTALGEDQREHVVLDQSDLIQHFLLGRLDAYWSPPLGRFDYTRVQHVFRLRDQLKLFSPEFDARREQIEGERHDLLAKLGARLEQAVDNDVLFEDEPGSAAEILQRIGALDPDSALLKNSRLELKYDAAIGQSIDVGKFNEARSRIALALQLFPDSTRLLRRRGQFEEAVAYAAAHPDAHTSPMSLNDARHSLVQLAANPSTSSQWRDAVASAMAAVQGDDSPDTSKAIATLVQGIIDMVAKVSDPAQAQTSLDLVEAGLRYVPHSQQLATQRDRMQALLQQQKIDQQIASGDAASLTNAVRLAASAKDGPRALTAFDHLRSLQPSDPFVNGEGPRLVTVAFIGNARLLCQQGKVADAANVASKGASAMNGDSRLGNAAQRYQVAAEILAARGQLLADPDYDDLRARYSNAAQADPDGMQQLEHDLGNSVTLPQGSLSGLLEQIHAQSSGAAAGDPGASSASAATGASMSTSASDAAVLTADPAQTASTAASGGAGN